MATQSTLQNYFNGLLPCAADNTTCLSNITLDDLLNFQDNLSESAFSLDPSTGTGQPIRVVRDGTLITTALDDTMPFPHVSKPLLISNVKNEAALSIYTGAPVSLNADTYDFLVEQTFGDPATETILNSTFYAIPSTDQDNDDFDSRPTLELLGTDQIWRCPGWTFARNWVSNGGAAYVGHYVVGASYPGNEAVPFCTQSGSVCHQDDIEIVVSP